MGAAGRGATGLTFWSKVYGFDFSLVQQELLEDAHQTALLKDVSRQDMLSSSCQLRQLDIAHMTAADASFSTDFVLEPTPEVSLCEVSELTLLRTCCKLREEFCQSRIDLPHNSSISAVGNPDIACSRCWRASCLL